ncbi:hypothetical protein [Pyxidicoccus trucidator]|uniref:hypothetical protein n=1 Tax=Pyxidicoccus trucidator TaxID=2709662 RepID=UPI0013D9D98E|nr:hypothetical protein [Pyxidicoccus trucidator]
MLALLGTVPFASAQAAEPVAGKAGCSKPEFAKARRSAEKLYRDGRYADAVEALRRTKESCWSALDATDRGWLVSDLGLATLRAGQPEVCRQVLAEAPAELDAGSRVAKAIAHNRGLCQGDGGFPVQVYASGLLISSPEEAPAALTREWNYSFALRNGRHPERRDREIDRCTETDGVELRDLDVRTTVDIYPAQGQLLRCRVLKRVTQARPSRVSHVRELFSSKALGKVLPADLAPAFAPGEDEQRALAGSEGRTWSEWDRKVRFEPDPDRKGTLRVQGDGVAGSLTLWAQGDFNGDGIEDVIVDRSMRPEGGSLVDGATFLLTRTQPGGVLTILERME